MWYAFDESGKLAYVKNTKKAILQEGYKAMTRTNHGVYVAVRVDDDAPYKKITIYDTADNARFHGMSFTDQDEMTTRANSDIIIALPLKRYLKEVTRDWGSPDEVYVNKTMGGQIWLSAEAPADTIEEFDDNKNYIEFNDSGAFIRAPKEAWPHIILEPGKSKTLKEVINTLR